MFDRMPRRKPACLILGIQASIAGFRSIHIRASCSRSCSICFGGETGYRCRGRWSANRLAVQNIGIVIQTVGPIGLFKSLFLHPGDGQQIAMGLRVRRSAENFTIVEDDGLQIHAYKLPLDSGGRDEKLEA